MAHDGTALDDRKKLSTPSAEPRAWAINNTKDLRSFLVEQMKAVANGEIDAVRTKGISNLAQQIYNTLNIELKAATAIHKLGEDREIKPVNFNG